MQSTRNSEDLLQSYPKIERTFHRRWKAQKQLHFVDPTTATDNTKILKDFAAQSAQRLYSSITRLSIEANNFEIKPSLLSIVQ